MCLGDVGDEWRPGGGDGVLVLVLVDNCPPLSLRDSLRQALTLNGEGALATSSSPALHQGGPSFSSRKKVRGAARRCAVTIAHVPVKPDGEDEDGVPGECHARAGAGELLTHIRNAQFSNLLGTVYSRGNLLFTPDGTCLLSPVGNRVSIFDLVK